MELQGVLSAIVTPFSADGETINETALRRLVNQSLDDGAHGFVPAGGTGEFATLSHAERCRLIDVVIEENNGRGTVLASTGATSTREAIALSKHAEDSGATALMLATPYYDRLNFDEAFAYYADVAAATSLPICAYNFPPATGLHLNTEFLVRLGTEIPQVKYVKDSSADLAQMQELRLDHADKITLLNGEDVIMLNALMIGTRGMVMGIANFAAPALRKMHDAAMAGDDLTVIQTWRQINPLVRQLGQGPYNSGVKLACELLGLETGPVRRPVRGLDASQKAALKATLDAIDPALLTKAALVEA